MRAVIQRVLSACVRVDGEVAGSIGRGILLLAGCEKGDTNGDYEWIASKVVNLRIFPSDLPDGGHFEKSLLDLRAEGFGKEGDAAILAVSQFTLLGDARKGRRPSFADAMPVEEAKSAFENFLGALRETGVPVATGVFQAMMEVESVNHGPVTIILDSRKRL